MMIRLRLWRRSSGRVGLLLVIAVTAGWYRYWFDSSTTSGTTTTNSNPRYPEDPRNNNNSRLLYYPRVAQAPVVPGNQATELYRPDDCHEPEDECMVVKPSFIILGAQKSGTTSMFKYLLQHPQMVALAEHTEALGGKEIRFFNSFPLMTSTTDTTSTTTTTTTTTATKKTPELALERYIARNFARMKEWSPQNRFQYGRGKRLVTGESTPDYLRSPEAPAQIRALLPNVKLIILMRDPVDRAYSHYLHGLRAESTTQSVKRGAPNWFTRGKTFEQLIDQELDILDQCLHLLNRIDWDAFVKCHHDKAAVYSRWLLQMVYRGMYAAQLRHWLRYFSADQFLVVQSEEFFRRPDQVMDRLSQFLGIDRIDYWQSIVKTIYNIGNGSSSSSVVSSVAAAAVEQGGAGARGADAYPGGPMTRETRRRLQAFFRPYNEDLRSIFQDGLFPEWNYNLEGEEMVKEGGGEEMVKEGREKDSS